MKCPKCNSVFVVPQPQAAAQQPAGDPLFNDPLGGGAGGQFQSPLAAPAQSPLGGSPQHSALGSPQLSPQAQWGAQPAQKPQQKAKSNAGLIIGLSVGGGVAVIAAVVVVILLAGGKDDPVVTSNSGDPLQNMNTPPINPPPNGNNTPPVVGNEMSPRSFIRAIAKANERLKSAGFRVGQNLGPALAGARVNSDALRQSLTAAQQAVQEVKSDMQDITPPNSNSARGLYNAHQGFLKAQEKMMTTEFEEIARIAEDNAMSPQVKRSRIQSLLSRLEATERSSSLPLVTALRTFAAEHRISASEVQRILQ